MGRRGRAAAALATPVAVLGGLGEGRHGVVKLAEELWGGSMVRRSGAGALYRRERRLGFAGTLRRPATGLMAVGLAWLCAGVNARRAEARCAPVMRRLGRRRCASSMAPVGGEVT